MVPLGCPARHWGVIIAVVGYLICLTWAALAEPPSGPHPRHPNRDTQQEARRPVPPAESVPPEQQQPYSADYQRACHNPQNPEEADLCQQWRSANAAEYVGSWSESQFFVGTISAGISALAAIFTAWAAIAASKAAVAAENSVVVAKDIGIRQLAASVFCGGFNGHPNVWGEKIKEYVFWVDVQNYGSTAAVDVRTWIAIDSAPDPSKLKWFKDFPYTETTAIIGPHSSVQTSVVTLSLDAMMACWNRKTCYAIWSRVEYKTIFDDKTTIYHEQSAILSLIRNPSDILPDGHVPIVRFWLDGPHNRTGAFSQAGAKPDSQSQGHNPPHGSPPGRTEGEFAP